VYWAILHRAGFKADAHKLHSLINNMDPGFSEKSAGGCLRDRQSKVAPPSRTWTFASEFEKFAEVDRKNKLMSSSKNKPLFDPDDDALLGFLKPKFTVGSGPSMIKPVYAIPRR